jgi:hypothetical protein
MTWFMYGMNVAALHPPAMERKCYLPAALDRTRHAMFAIHAVSIHCPMHPLSGSAGLGMPLRPGTGPDGRSRLNRGGVQMLILKY